MGIIYRYWSPSGKSYIGQTTGKFLKRDAKHKFDSTQPAGNCRLFHRALKKYSYDAFKKEILIECDDTDLDMFESKMIIAYNSLAPNGYNLTSGGNSNKYLSQDTKELLHNMRIANHDKNFPDYPQGVTLPFYILRWRRSDTIKGKVYEYKGYAVRGHPKCKHKFFGKSNKTLAENLEDAKQYLDKLEANEIQVQEKEILPDGIKRRRSSKRDGYEATYINTNGIVIKRRFTTEFYLKRTLDLAIKWLTECSSTTKCESVD